MNTSLTSNLAALNEANAKAAELAQTVENERNTVLKGLAAELGYASAEDFLTAYLAANGIKVRGTRKVKAAKATKTKSAKSGTRKARVTIDEAKGKEIIAFFEANGSTVDAVTKFNISLATAQNWKDKAGMVTHR